LMENKLLVIHNEVKKVVPKRINKNKNALTSKV